MICYHQFVTRSLVASYISNREPISGYMGYRNKDEFVLFDPNLLDEYYEFVQTHGNGIIKLRNVTEDQYQIFLQKNIPHTRTNLHSPIYCFSPSFFELDGHKYKDLRQAYNNYKDGLPDLENRAVRYPIVIKTQPNNEQEVIDLIHLWKEQRKDAHFQFFIGYEKNYYKRFYDLGKHVSLYFYSEDRLIGYNILEQIDDCRFNLLYGKVDMRYKRFFNYMDLSTYRYIFENITKGEIFYVNSGDTGGDQTMLDFKTKLYDVYDISPICNITIDQNKKYKKLF